MLQSLPMLPCSDLGGQALFMFVCSHNCQQGILMACPRSGYSAPLRNQSSTEQLSHSSHLIFTVHFKLECPRFPVSATSSCFSHTKWSVTAWCYKLEFVIILFWLIIIIKNRLVCIANRFTIHCTLLFQLFTYSG